MKKGQMVPETLVKLVIITLNVVLVVMIVVFALSIFQKGKTPQDADFKAVLDASAKLLQDFQDGKIKTGQFTVPMSSEEKFQIVFFPQGDTEMWTECRGKTCLCMRYYIKGEPKKTCKIIDIQATCQEKTCGKELCAGSKSDFDVQRGDNVKIAIACNAGQQLAVSKA